MINPTQLREIVIIPTLNYLSPVIPTSAAAVDLLMGTAIQESDCGTYLEQIRGPAVGVWQMEPATAYNHGRWLHEHPEFAAIITSLTAPIPQFVPQMVTNLMLACAMARIHYWRAPGAIPSTLEGQAAYWKQWYNTPLGAGTVEQYIANYKKVMK